MLKWRRPKQMNQKTTKKFKQFTTDMLHKSLLQLKHSAIHTPVVDISYICHVLICCKEHYKMLLFLYTRKLSLKGGKSVQILTCSLLDTSLLFALTQKLSGFVVWCAGINVELFYKMWSKSPEDMSIKIRSWPISRWTAFSAVQRCTGSCLTGGPVLLAPYLRLHDSMDLLKATTLHPRRLCWLAKTWWYTGMHCSSDGLPIRLLRTLQ